MRVVPELVARDMAGAVIVRDGVGGMAGCAWYGNGYGVAGGVGGVMDGVRSLESVARVVVGGWYGGGCVEWHGYVGWYEPGGCPVKMRFGRICLS